jgi:hypothetical protein
LWLSSFGWEGTFGRGRTCGSSVSAAVTDDSGRGGSRTKLGDCDIFLKNLVPKSKTVWAFWGVSTPGASVGAAVTGDFGRGGTQSALGRLKKQELYVELPLEIMRARVSRKRRLVRLKRASGLDNFREKMFVRVNRVN